VDSLGVLLCKRVSKGETATLASMRSQTKKTPHTHIPGDENVELDVDNACTGASLKKGRDAVCAANEIHCDTHTHTHTHSYTHRHTGTHTCTHARMPAHTLTHMHTHTHTHTRTHARMHTHAHACTNTHRHTGAHTRTHTCAHLVKPIYEMLGF
jgi:hypothetical protein